MARALGIGGVFFKCADRKRLADWYTDALNLPIGDFGGAELPVVALPDGAYSVWGPFDRDTDYFAPSSREFMINLVVDDVEQSMRQVEAAGGTRIGEIERDEYGLFAWFVDPEGNKVELWQPPAVE